MVIKDFKKEKSDYKKDQVTFNFLKIKKPPFP